METISQDGTWWVLDPSIQCLGVVGASPRYLGQGKARVQSEEHVQIMGNMNSRTASQGLFSIRQTRSL